MRGQNLRKTFTAKEIKTGTTVPRSKKGYKGIVLSGFALLILLLPSAIAQQAAAHKPRLKASAIQVRMIESPEVKLPAAFQVSLYEDMVTQLSKNGGLAKVYREGDKNADNASDLVIVRTTLRGFKEGSERLRQVTTVTGTTSITAHCTFTDKDGKTLLEQDLTGYVRFFGANLRATLDLAKKTAQMTRNNFSPAAGT